MLCFVSASGTSSPWQCWKLEEILRNTDKLSWQVQAKPGEEGELSNSCSEMLRKWPFCCCFRLKFSSMKSIWRTLSESMLVVEAILREFSDHFRDLGPSEKFTADAKFTNELILTGESKNQVISWLSSEDKLLKCCKVFDIKCCENVRICLSYFCYYIKKK